MTKQIAQGYKQTKVGVIPEDWEVEKIQKLFNKFSTSVEVNPENLYQEIGIRSHGKGIFYKEKLSGYDLGNKSVFWIHPDCLILNIVFAWEQAIAKTTENEIGFIASHRFPMYKPDQERAVLDFFLYFFKSKRGKLSLELASPGGAGRNKTLGQLEFAKLDVPLPPKKEQEKIAEILTTWDDAIAKQEQLIKQQQVFKKGIMQQIFSQKIRFKDNNGNDYPAWQSKKLSGITNITIGEFVIKTKQNPNGLYPVFNGGVCCTGFYDEFNNEGNKIIISARGANAGYVNFEKRKYWAGNSCYSVDIIDKKLYNINYFHYYIKFNQNKFVDNQQAANIPSVSKKDVQNFRIMLPNFAEQTKIADFLTSVDDEITKQTEVLDQLKLQKQSLMQKLLTGQVRVLT